MDSAVAKDKRIKREIANSNERRRMQSINAGFQKLKRLLPVNDGEKISKANILQHAANYITSVERDRISMYEHNTLIRQILMDLKGGKIDIDSALNSIDSNANTLLSVPLNLQVTMASGSSTPASFPTPRTSPTTPTLASTVATSATTKSANISQALFKVTTTTTTTSTTVTTSNNASNNNNSSETTTTKLTAKSAQRTSKAPRRPSTRNNSNLKSNNSSTINNNNNTITATTTNNSQEEADTIGANSNSVNNNTDGNQNIGSVADIISDKIASPKNGLSTPSCATKAAIALPLEVPYTSEIIIGSHHNHHHHHHHQTDTNSDITGPRKLLKTGTTTSGSGIDTTDSVAKSNQTLDTICKAIMVIEGDRAYKNEKP